MLSATACIQLSLFKCSGKCNPHFEIWKEEGLLNRAIDTHSFPALRRQRLDPNVIGLSKRCKITAKRLTKILVYCCQKFQWRKDYEFTTTTSTLLALYDLSSSQKDDWLAKQLCLGLIWRGGNHPTESNMKTGSWKQVELFLEQVNTHGDPAQTAVMRTKPLSRMERRKHGRHICKGEGWRRWEKHLFASVHVEGHVQFDLKLPGT